MSTRDYVPGKAPPPVAERPKCAWCDTPLRPVIMHDWERRQHGTLGNFFEVPINRRWTGGYDSYGNFCKQGCAVNFANAAHRAGFRRKET